MTVICKIDVIRLKGELTHSVFNFYNESFKSFSFIFLTSQLRCSQNPKTNLEIEMFDQIETENTLHQIVSRSWNVIDHSEDFGRGVGWYFML